MAGDNAHQVTENRRENWTRFPEPARPIGWGRNALCPSLQQGSLAPMIRAFAEWKPDVLEHSHKQWRRAIPQNEMIVCP